MKLTSDDERASPVDQHAPPPNGRNAPASPSRAQSSCRWLSDARTKIRRE